MQQLGRRPEISSEHKEKIDDAGFVAVIVGTLRKVYNVDSHRVFATGISNREIFGSGKREPTSTKHGLTVAVLRQVNVL